jgi:hypothetical protein
MVNKCPMKIKKSLINLCEFLQFFESLTMQSVLDYCTHQGASTQDSSKVKEAFKEPDADKEIL